VIDLIYITTVLAARHLLHVWTGSICRGICYIFVTNNGDMFVAVVIVMSMQSCMIQAKIALRIMPCMQLVHAMSVLFTSCCLMECRYLRLNGVQARSRWQGRWWRFPPWWARRAWTQLMLSSMFADASGRSARSLTMPMVHRDSAV
jgi:hypothetical protein